MHVEIIETSPLEREVQVAVEAEAVNEECQKALNQLRGRVKVRGFRPGKVPRRELERRYGKSVRRDVLKTLIQTTLSTALRRDDLKAVLHVSPPEVVDDPGEGGFSYRFLAEVRPEVTPKGYLGVAVDVPVEGVSVEEIDREVERLRKQHAIIEPIEDREVAEAKDWVTISYRRLGGDAEADAKPTDMGVDLTDDTLPPSLRDGIIGMAVGSTEAVTLESPAPIESGEAAEGGERAEAVELEVTLQGIKRRILPDLDDDLASMVGEFDTLEELRAEIEKQLSARAEEARKAQRQRRMEDHLLASADFVLPEAYLASRLDDEVRSRLQSFDQSQVPVDTDLVAAMKEQVRPDVERRVRLELVLSAIAERENVAVSDGDIDIAIEDLVRPAGTHAATLRRLYEKPSHRVALKERIRLDKTLDFLLSKATIPAEVASGAAVAASTSESPHSAGAQEASAATPDSHGEADGD